MAQFDPSDRSRFDDFTIFTTTYKTIHGHEITTDILYPQTLSQKTLQSTPRPVILRYHGGGLIAGSSLFPPFFNSWYLELAKEHSAIIVSPDYRLIPEATVLEVLEDIEDHWKWLHESLPQYLHQQTDGAIQADLSRILTVGDSAGGYLSILMGLRHSDEIRAVNAVYPVTYPKSDHFSDRKEKTVLGLPSLPKDMLERHLETVREREAATKEKAVITEGGDQERIGLMFGITQQAILGTFFPSDAVQLHPLEMLDAGSRFPRGGVLILHGRDDTVSPVDQSYKLKEKIEEVDSALKFRLVVRDGEHGFDQTAKLHDPWLWEAVQGIVGSWLE